MNKILYIIIVLIISQAPIMAQTSVNNYKYVIIPKQFEFQSSEDQYQINSLTKFLFNKYGFTAFFEDENLPEDISKNRCLGLKTNVRKVKGFLITRLQIDLLDCNGKVVSSSQIGETKVKEYAKAYNIAIRGAFQTYQYMGYKYEPKVALVEGVSSTSNKTPENITSEAQKETVPAIKTVDKSKDIKVVEAAAATVAVSAKQTQEKNIINGELQEVETTKDILYAQPIDNGFQIVDTEPKKVMVLLFSGVTDSFIVQGKDAIVYKKGDAWIYAENDGANLMVKRINLKF